MYASIDFTSKREFKDAVKNGTPVVLYSPTLGMPAVNGRVIVEGPWPVPSTQEPTMFPMRKPRRSKPASWRAMAEVRDMRIVAVH